MRDPAAPIAAIIVNWNGASDTLAVLEELGSVEGLALRTIVVENGSTDDSLERLESSDLEFELIKTGDNLGFAGGNLVGIVLNNINLSQAAGYYSDYYQSYYYQPDETEEQPEAEAKAETKPEIKSKF